MEDRKLAKVKNDPANDEAPDDGTTESHNTPSKAHTGISTAKYL